MRRTLTLQPLRNAPPLVFEYDDETGLVAGRDAAVAAVFIAAAEHARFVEIEPHPQSHRVGPAPHSWTDVAAIFGRWYRLPAWLDELRPKGESEPDDAGDNDVDPIY